MCMGAIYWAQLSRIVFAASDPKQGYINAQTTPHPKATVSGGVMESEAAEMLKNFFSSRRK